MYVVKLLPKRLTRAEHTVADCKDKLTKLMLNSPSMSRCNYYDVLMHLAIQDHLYVFYFLKQLHLIWMISNNGFIRRKMSCHVCSAHVIIIVI